MKRVQKVFDNLFGVGSFRCGFFAEIKLKSVVELLRPVKHFCPKIGHHKHSSATVQVAIQALEFDRQ